VRARTPEMHACLVHGNLVCPSVHVARGVKLSTPLPNPQPCFLGNILRLVGTDPGSSDKPLKAAGPEEGARPVHVGRYAWGDPKPARNRPAGRKSVRMCRTVSHPSTDRDEEF
jgi:hypothetical protein